MASGFKPHNSSDTAAADLGRSVAKPLANLRAHSSLATAIGQSLLIAWNEPHRRHHNIAHLRDVLLHIDELATHASDLECGAAVTGWN